MLLAFSLGVALPPLPIPWRNRLDALTRRFAPRGRGELRADEARQVRLFLGFSVLGLVFGTLFAGFYLWIGHRWAGLIISACTAAMALAPRVVRARGLTVAGNAYASVLVAGFVGLSAIEAGIHGHAVAWLAVVPLCVCILVGSSRTGGYWCAFCLVAVGGFWLLEAGGVTVPALYPPGWAAFITGAGYVTLTVFMSLLGMYYENGRRRSLEELQTALRELSEANGRLQHLDAERREFLSIAAHDLRGPLSVILGHAQLGLRQNGSASPHLPGVNRAFEQINVAGDRMRELLDQVLGEQAIEEGRLKLAFEDCDTDVLAAAAVSRHRPAAWQKGVPLQHFPCPAAAWVRADPKVLGQILDNLVSNAVKFSPPGRPVRVGARTGENHAGGRVVLLEVADAGPGLSEDDLGRLFGRFARLSAKPTAGEPSTGLGLSIVKRLAEALGGHVGCQSRLGEGATFTLELPWAAAPAPVFPQPMLLPSTPKVRTTRIRV